MSKSFSLLSTNVGLTTNIKIMITSDYKLSLDSIDSDVNLSYDKFKKVSFNKDNYYDELIPYFYKDLPSEIAFKIKYDEDSESMSNDFKDQYDEIYQHGARNISNNKNYKEEYEYFAPLYFDRDHLPKNFIIFRVDGAGIGSLSKENFKTEILKKLKTVKLFDLTTKTPLGEWMSKNFLNNKFFPESSLDIDFRNLEFCRWNGIDYKNGGYTYKSLFIDDILDEEKEIFELEKFAFDSYKNNGVVFPNILNMSFLFDDTPSTPEIKRKWSINRYYGFYLNELELVKTLSPYNPPTLHDDVVILDGNILKSDLNDSPFVKEWSDKEPFYIEYDNNYYKVEQFLEKSSNKLVKKSNALAERDERNLGFRAPKGKSNDIVKKSVTTNTKSSIEELGDVEFIRYRIISDISLAGKTGNDLNNNFGQIELLTNRLIDSDNNSIIIENFDIQSDNIGVWIIEIDGIYHNIVKDEVGLKLYTDHSFIFNQNDYVYKVGGVSTKVNTYVDFNNMPKKFSIYRLQFTDIKSFDNRIIDTEYSKYEYEKASDLTNTDETKMYLDNIGSKSDPIELDDFLYKNEVVNIPVSSEYTANYETFKVDTQLSSIWRKNPVYCRWGFNKSLSSNDMPYLLNNSLIFEDHNRTSNVYESIPKRMERNLDYFYTINSNSSSYTHHSLHIEKVNDGIIDNTFSFDLSKYLNFDNYNNDYFTYFFKRKSEFYNSKISKNTTKFSLFNVGDESVPNHSIFRGIRFDIFEVNNISLKDNNIEKANIKSSNKFNNYKFSILLSDNNYKLSNKGVVLSNKNNIVDGVINFENALEWIIIKEWRMDVKYVLGDIVIFDNILYIQGNDQQRINKPIFKSNDVIIPSNPSTQGFIIYNNTIFWDGNTGGQDFIYYDGEYYQYNSENNAVVDFWNPTSSYMVGDVVMYKNINYKSIKDNNIFPINFKEGWVKFDTLLKSKWKIIQAWNPNVGYNGGKYIVYQNVLYKLKGTNTINTIRSKSTISAFASINDIPNISDIWVRQYSIVPDTDFIYNNSVSNNSIIEMNNAYYMCLNNDKVSTLDNGLIIYINNKYKNILININIADNTYTNISGTNRDDLYDEIYSKLTASNFINYINDINNKYGFADYITYVIIDDDAIKQYSSALNNISDVPYLIRCEEPEKLSIKVNSLFKRPVEVPAKLTPFRSLKNGKIIDLNKLNYFNNIPIACNIIENEFEPKVYENYHGNRNILKNDIYRYSGYYSPVFYDIQIFESNCEYCKEGNYKFDTSLTDFGIVKERKVRKINRKGDILRLSNENDVKSIYPMLDEFGYSIYDFFIFSSTWDIRYYLETTSLSTSVNYLQKYKTEQNIERKDIPINIPTDIGQSQNL